MTDDEGRTRREGLSELAEDAVGFGGQELRLTRDLILRPRAVMDAYDAHGSTAGGRYPKPLRYYLTLNGVYLLLIALLGGLGRSLASLPPEMLTAMARSTGKSVEAFSNDMDKWFSILSVPLISIFVAGAAYLFIRRWSPADDRQDFRQTFVFMSGWTLYGAPFGLVSIFAPSLAAWIMLISLGIILLLFARLGPGRWWRSRAQAWSRGAVFLLVTFLAQIPASLSVWGLAYLGARYLP